MNVEGKVIVITGAARGLGQEYARYLGGLGARIVVGDLNDCAQTVDLVKTEGGTAVGTKLDVANSSSAQDMARTTLDMFGRIDALVNNAALFGALKGGHFDAIPEADWDAAMAVNVKGSGTAARP
jgi:NAD(P)-dependent dehydrogenase (short-subunit alcohol dehydrogenase family)